MWSPLPHLSTVGHLLHLDPECDLSISQSEQGAIVDIESHDRNYTRSLPSRQPVWQQWETGRETWRRQPPPSWEQSRSSPPGSSRRFPTKATTVLPVDRYSILKLYNCSLNQALIFRAYEIAVHQKVSPSKVILNLIFLDGCRRSVCHKFRESQDSHDGGLWVGGRLQGALWCEKN